MNVFRGLCVSTAPAYIQRVGAHTMYYGYGGDKPGTTHKKLSTTPRFFSWPRPPVRFYTVEALCRYVLFHSTPPLSLLRSSYERCTVERALKARR